MKDFDDFSVCEPLLNNWLENSWRILEESLKNPWRILEESLRGIPKKVNDCGVAWGSFDCPLIALILLWYCSGIVMESRYDCSGTALRLRWNLSLEWHWSRPGIAPQFHWWLHVNQLFQVDWNCTGTALDQNEMNVYQNGAFEHLQQLDAIHFY